MTTAHRPATPHNTEQRQLSHSTLRVHSTHQPGRQLNMESTRRLHLTRMRAAAKSSLTRTQTFKETADRKLNDIQVKFQELPNIFNKFETAQSELQMSDDADHPVDRQQFEEQYFEVKARFNELHPVVDPPLSRHSSPRNSLSEHNSNVPQSPASSTRINIKLPDNSPNVRGRNM